MENLKLNEDSLAFLRRASLWARLISIAGFVCLGFAFVGVFISAVIGDALKNALVAAGVEAGLAAIMGIVYLAVMILIIALSLMTMISLNCFANRTRRALDDGDTLTLAQSLGSLKNYFTYLGVTIIVWLIIVPAMSYFWFITVSLSNM